MTARYVTGLVPISSIIGANCNVCFLQKSDVDRSLLEARYVPLADSASAFRFKKPAAPRKAALRIWCRHLSKAPGGGAGDG